MVLARLAWHGTAAPRTAGRYASALAALEEQSAKDKGPPPREKLELKAELLEALGWAHWATNVRALLLLKFPAAYPPPYV